MTDISVETTAYQTENRSWLIPQPGGIGHGYTPSGTLSVAAFTAGTHYPNGFVPSGTALGRITASGLLGPYDPAATDGRETAVGFLFASLPVKSGGANKGCAYVAAFAVVKTSKLPFQSGTGSLDAAGQADLPTIHFEA